MQAQCRPRKILTLSQQQKTPLSFVAPEWRMQQDCASSLIAVAAGVQVKRAALDLGSRNGSS